MPLKRGLTFQIEIGPRLANCPKANSKKNSGRPTRPSIMTYGRRKAPIVNKK